MFKFLAESVMRTLESEVARDIAPPANVRQCDLIACQLSGIAYEKFGERRKFLDDLNFIMLYESETWYICVSELRSEGYVVFRGTASAQDVLTDIAIEPSAPIGNFHHSDRFKTPREVLGNGEYPKPLPPNVKQFHGGIFVNLMNKTNLRTALRELGFLQGVPGAPGCDAYDNSERSRSNQSSRTGSKESNGGETAQKGPETRFWKNSGTDITTVGLTTARWYFTGHSLGGGMAQMCTVLLEKGYLQHALLYGFLNKRGEAQFCSNGKPEVAALPAVQAPYEAISFAAPPIFFDHMSKMRAGEFTEIRGASSSSRNANTNPSGARNPSNSGTRTGASTSSRNGNHDAACEQHPHHDVRYFPWSITAFVYGNDPVPRLDRQDETMVVKALQKWRGGQMIAHNFNHFMHSPNQTTIWFVPKGNMSGALQMAGTVMKGFQGFFSGGSAPATSSSINDCGAAGGAAAGFFGDITERLANASTAVKEEEVVTEETRPHVQAVSLSNKAEEHYSRQRQLLLDDFHVPDHLMSKYEWGMRDYFTREFANLPLAKRIYEKKVDFCG